MRNKDIFSNDNKILLVKSIYLAMIVSYFFLFIFLCFTNGSIRYFLHQNLLYILLPMLLPLILSLVGLNDFKIEKNAEYIKIYSNCIFMSKFSDNYSEKIIVNINEPYENNFSISHFWVKKIISRKTKDKNKSLKVKLTFLFYQD